MNIKKIIYDCKQNKENLKENIESKLIELGLDFAIDNKCNVVIMRRTMVNTMGERVRFLYEDDNFEKFKNDEIACTWPTNLVLVMELIPFDEDIEDQFQLCSYVPFSPDFQDIKCENNIFKILSKDKEPLLLDFETLAQSAKEMLKYFLQTGIDIYMSDRCIANNIRFKEEERLKAITKLEDKKKKSEYNKKMSVLPPITINTLVPEHFILNEKMELELLLWGKKCSMNIYSIDLCKINNKDMEQILITYIKNFQKAIDWINKNQDLFVQEILNDGMFDLAQSNLENYDEIDIDGKTYVFIDSENGEQKIEIPITEKYFVNSLYINSFHLDFDIEKFDFDMFIDTEPDYFGCHSIEIFFDYKSNSDYSITIN